LSILKYFFHKRISIDAQKKVSQLIKQMSHPNLEKITIGISSIKTTRDKVELSPKKGQQQQQQQQQQLTNAHDLVFLG